MRPKALAWRIAAVYWALFSGIGVFMPFLPVWLKARGLNVEQIALVLALQSMMRVAASPAISHLADRIGRLRPVMIAAAAAALAGLLCLTAAEGFAAIALWVGLAYGAFAPLPPMTEAYTVSAGRRFGLDYGRMRLWGSLAFIAGSLSAGAALDVLRAGRLIWLIVAAQGALLALLTLLPPRGERAEAGRAFSAGTAPARFSFLAPAFVVFLLAAGLAQGSHALVYGFSALHWKAQGHSGATVGALWGAGVLAEVALFWFSGGVMARLGAVRLLMLGAAAGAARWAGLSMDPPLSALFALQALHGLSFGAAHLGAIEYIRTRTPAHLAATAQAVYAAVTGGVFMTAAMWASGPLYERYRADAWWVMAAMAAGAFVLTLALRRISPREPVRAAGG